MSKLEQAQKEYDEVREWVLDEEDRVVEKLKLEGRYVRGLDGNQADFAYIYEKRNKRIKEIKEKYNLN